MSKRLILIVAVAVMLLSSAGIVTFLSAQEGDIPAAPDPAQGDEPLETRFAPDRIHRTGGDDIWRVSASEGILLSRDGGRTWTNVTKNLPGLLPWG